MITDIIEKIGSVIPFIGTEEIVTTLLAMTPVVGIRGAIPLAIFGYEMDIYSAFFWSVLGEFFPVFFILLFLGVVSEWLSRRKAMVAIFFGVLFSGINIILLLQMGVAIEKYRGPMTVVGLIALASLVYFLYHRRNKKKNV